MINFVHFVPYFWLKVQNLVSYENRACVPICVASRPCCTNYDDLICTTPRLCQNNMTPVALRGRGTTSAHNCFPATGLYFKSKVLASVGRGSTETTRLQHGSSMFGDTHAGGGGGGGGIWRQAWLHGFPHPCEMRMAS